MKKQSGNKALLIGVFGVVVIVLAVALALLLSQCVGGQSGKATEPTVDTAVQPEGYELYWNLDRKEFDGKSEAGMSSRKPASDGFFHVRFFKDGEILELKVADRKLINTIDTTDLMGLEFDENGIVVGIIRADRLPLERVGWLFYVQSTGGNLIKLNSSRRFDGLEVLLEVEDYTAIYDMTGLEGDVGRKVKLPSESDRVIAIADLQGRVTHVFITDRSEFMFTVEAECQHCKQVVSWKLFTKTNEFPSMSGHYILQNDITLKGSQVQLPEDSSICVDLNGKTVSKSDGGRMIALFNPGCKLAIMDTSEEQTGTILVSGEGTQGLGVWLRYGEFHFYGGTIDATAANTRSGGAAVALDANTYMYMHGGTIRGGNAQTEYDPVTGAYSRGMGGAVLVLGKFVMNDGVIEDGKAIPITGYNAKGQRVNNRGYGGNLLARGNGTVELNGGIIRNGYAGTAGGNLFIDGTAELLLNGTQIKGGYVDGRGCNGGSVYIGGKAKATMNGGSITGGYCFNEGANVYCSGTFTMQGGYIGGGKVFTYGTREIKESCCSANFFLVNGTLKHYAGTIAGNVHAIDTSKTRVCAVYLGGSPVIDGGESCKVNLNLNTYGDGVKLIVGKLSDKARIGVNSVGIFSEKTDAANADNFFSDIGSEVIHYQERLAVGKLGCICGSQTHFGACDGTVQLWVPHSKEDTLPVTGGFWYLIQDVQLLGQQNIKGEQNVVLDLNGHTVTSADGSRAYAVFDPEAPITLTLTDSSEEKTGTIKAVGKNVQVEGQCVWIRTAGQTVNLYDVTLDASEAVNNRNGAALYANAGTIVNMYAGHIVGGTAQAWYKETAKTVVNGMGGNVYTNGTFNMYGGSISGGKALSALNESNGTYTGGIGGNLAAGAEAQLNLLGGTVEGGHADSAGGNICLYTDASATLSAGTVTGGNAGDGGNVYIYSGAALGITGGTVEKGFVTKDGAGNIDVRGTLTVSGGTVTGGYRVNKDGQTVALSLEKANLFAFKSDVTITGGKIDGGVMIHTNQTKLTLSGEPQINGNPGLTLNAGALMTLEGLGEKACVVLSNGENTQLTEGGEKTGLVSDKGLLISADSTGALWLRGHTHCSAGCGGVNGSHADGCTGTDEAWTLWDGSAITQSGKYCLHTEAEDGKVSIDQMSIGAGLDVAICLNGKTLSGNARAFLIKDGGKLTIMDCTGKGILEGKGPDKDSGGVICLADGQLDLYSGTLRKVDDESIAVSGGGVVRVDANGVMNIHGGTVQGGTVTGIGGAISVAGALNIYGGTVSGGNAANGGAINVNGGQVTMYGGNITKGVAVNGGNVFVTSGSFTMKEDGNAATVPQITEGQTTGDGGNVYVNTGAFFTMDCGQVKDGYISLATKDSAGNIYVRGTLTVTGGTVSGGHRNGGGSLVKCNIFVYQATMNMSGGTVDGGVNVYDSVANRTKLNLSKDARIVAGDAAKPSLTVTNGTVGITVTEALTDKAEIVLSNSEGTVVMTNATHAMKNRISSDRGLKLSVESDNKMYLRSHTHCTADCGKLDGQHEAACAGYDVPWTKWNGGNITASGKYCIHDTVQIDAPAEITATGVTLRIEGMLTSTKRALNIQSGAEVTLQGAGVVEGKGVNNENTGVVIVDGKLTVDGVTLQRIEDSAIVVKNGGVMTVGSTGEVIMESGIIRGGKVSNGGGNVFVNGGSFTLKGGSIESGTALVGGNIFLYSSGSFTQKSGIVTGGTATGSGAQGGNVSISSGHYTLEGGSVESGRISVDGAGNIDVRSAGTLTVSGGTVSGGSRIGGGSEVKRNIFVVNGKVNVSGGQLCGGVNIHGGSGRLNLSKDAAIRTDEAGKLSLSVSGGALLTVDGALHNADIVLSNDADTKLAASGSHAYKKHFSSDKGLVVSVEADGMYLRAADAHIHCLCARTDGTHAEGCDGFDVIFSATTAFPTTTGTYFVNEEVLSTGALQLGKSDGTGAVDVVLCLNGRTVTTPNTNTARVALIWKNSSLTITDCGKGTIKPNAATVGNGAIFHPAAGSTLTVYNGTLDASGLSTAKNGAAIDNAGTLYIRGGLILGGLTTQRGGAVNNTGNLFMSGGTISGGRVGNRGGNIYSENGNVTISGGIVENGKAYADTSGNIDVRNGSLTISGGTISGGNRYTNNTFATVHASGEVKRNIFTVNTNVTITGGQINGGVQLYTSGSGSAKISGKPKIVSADGKASLTTGYVMTILAPGMDKDARIKVTSAPAGAFAVAESGLTLTSEMAACFENASGVKATLENNQFLFK